MSDLASSPEWAALIDAMVAVRFAKIVREESTRTVLVGPADVERIRAAVTERGGR